jgi:N-acyl-D-amino-acid deacylase
MKVGGKPNWWKIDALIEMVEAARSEGLEVRCDRYPYEAWSTNLGINFPGWSKEGGQFQQRLRDVELRERMRAETLHNVESNGGWGVLMVSGGVSGADRDLIGQRIDAIAEHRGVDPFELSCDLLSRSSVSIIGFGMSDENTERIISLPYCMIGSDGSALPTSDEPGGHPRSFGTFPRAIRRFVHERKLVALEEMIRKMTSLPAETFDLKNRGTLQAGMIADIVVFDPDRMVDRATYIEPRKYAEGVAYLLVNGELAIEQGQITDRSEGRVVRVTR